jgi:hypothetical protein
MYLCFALTTVIVGYSMLQPIKKISDFVYECVKYKYNKFQDKTEHFDFTHRKMSYIYRNRKYQLLLPSYNIPSNILQVVDVYENDVTDYIIQYLGPNEDWHGHKLTPTKLGFNYSLTFLFLEGEDKIYKHDEIINLEKTCEDTIELELGNVDTTELELGNVDTTELELGNVDTTGLESDDMKQNVSISTEISKSIFSWG